MGASTDTGGYGKYCTKTGSHGECDLEWWYISMSKASDGVYKASEKCGVHELAIMVSTGTGSGGG